MQIREPQYEIPVGLTGGSDLWDNDTAGLILRSEFFSPAPTAAILRYWDGSNWSIKPLKYWDGSNWIAKSIKSWNGSAWI